MEDLIFFDSHGNPWVTCSPDEPGAEAVSYTHLTLPTN